MPGPILRAMDFYETGHRQLQDQFETRRLADTLEASIVSDEIGDEHAEFISTRDFFFLSSVNTAGEPTVSYKGGPVGLVHIVDPKTVLFPIYDGNGMFLSAGNISATAKIGMLFIDFETPHRVRLQARASISTQPDHLELFPGALVAVEAHVDSTFVNCGRYIHKHSRIESSKHVPGNDGRQPLAMWKRIDLLQDSLAPKDQGSAAMNGGTITSDEYAEAIRTGES